MTAKVPGTEHFLINPFGYFYNEVTASSLVKIDLDGNILGGPPGARFNYAGYVIPSAVHQARGDVGCVVHTHTTDNMAVAVMARGSLPFTITALRFHERLGYHDFEGPAVGLEERERNHGALTCGRTIAGAFILMNRLEVACRVQVKFLAANTPLQAPNEESQLRTSRLLAPQSRGGDSKIGDQSYALEWQAELRRLDRIDASYAT